MPSHLLLRSLHSFFLPPDSRIECVFPSLIRCGKDTDIYIDYKTCSNSIQCNAVKQEPTEWIKRLNVSSSSFCFFCSFTTISASCAQYMPMCNAIKSIFVGECKSVRARVRKLLMPNPFCRLRLLLHSHPGHIGPHSAPLLNAELYFSCLLRVSCVARARAATFAVVADCFFLSFSCWFVLYFFCSVHIYFGTSNFGLAKCCDPHICAVPRTMSITVKSQN